MTSKTESTGKLAAEKSALLKEHYDTFPDRMGLLAELAGNAHQLSIKTGQSASGVRTYIAGAEPTRPVLIKLANAAGVSIEWLVTGNGAMRDIPVATRTAIAETYFNYCRSDHCGGKHPRNELEVRIAFVNAYNQGGIARKAEVTILALYELQQWLQEYSQPTSPSEEFIRVPFYDLDIVDDDSFSAQTRAAALRSAQLCMHRDLLVNTWKLDPEKVSTFIVHNDDMYPFLRPGDWVLCDCRQSRSHRNGIYLIRQDDELVFRRAQFIGNERVRLTRENREHNDSQGSPAQEAVENGAKTIAFVGRVVLKMNRVRL